MNYLEIEAGVGGLSSRTVRDRMSSIERHMDVLERVLLLNTAAAVPLTCQHETSGLVTVVTY